MHLPMPAYPETVCLLYDKCLMRGHQGKTNAALVAQGKSKGNSKGKGKGQSSQAKSSEQKGNKHNNKEKQECTFCGRSGHLEEQCYTKRDLSKKAKAKLKSPDSTPSSNDNGKDKKEDGNTKIAYLAHSPSLSTCEASSLSKSEDSLVVITPPSPHDLEASAKEE